MNYDNKSKSASKLVNLINDIKIVKNYLPWLLIILSVEIIAIILLWLADFRLIKSLIALIIFTTFIVFILISNYVIKKEKRKEKLILKYLENQDEESFRNLVGYIGKDNSKVIYKLNEVLLEKDNSIQGQREINKDYEAYVET